MSDLKVCPFCGTDPMESSHGHVKCRLFHCVAHKRWMTKEEWNARPTESALLAALKAVEIELGRICDDKCHGNIKNCGPTCSVVEARETATAAIKLAGG